MTRWDSLLRNIKVAMVIFVTIVLIVLIQAWAFMSRDR